MIDLRERVLGLMGRSDPGDPQLLHVARARDMQHATNPAQDATGSATTAQQPAPLPREDRATTGATTAQPSLEPPATGVQQDAQQDEVALFEQRKARVIWLGYRAADYLADRLLHRDRDLDDRRLCVECRHARPAFKCAVANAFMLDMLQRCEGFEQA